MEDGCLPSYPLTQSFIINENLTMPVISIAADNPATFVKKYNSTDKSWEMPCNVAYLVDDGFNIDCGTCVAGWGSILWLEKRSLDLFFRSAYGENKVKYDFFGTGEKKYGSLCLRGGGQDFNCRMFTDDMWQDLALQMNEDALTQHTMPCILFVNGEYWGIFSLKENLNREWFADKMSVPKETVEKGLINRKAVTEEFGDGVVKWALEHDMTVPENYEYISSLINIDSFIEWLIVQGVSGNIDHENNVSVYRSSALDGKWNFPIYDLDFSVQLGIKPWDKLWLSTDIIGWTNKPVTRLFKALITNDEFKDQLLTTYAKYYDTVFSLKNILAVSEHYREMYEPEAERNCRRWHYIYDEWVDRVDAMERLFVELDWTRYGVLHLCRDYLHMTDEEIAHYFNF